MSTPPTWPPPVGEPIGTDAEQSTRPESPRSSGRVLAVVIVVALLCGVGLVLAGLRNEADNDRVVLDIESARVPVPSTVAPIVTAPPTTVTVTTAPAEAPPEEPVVTEPPLSPLADLLGPQYSAVPEEVEPRPRPVGMDIDAFDVSTFPVRPVGLEPDGQLEVPDETEIGWYQYGATAGRPGATVLAAHVSWNRTVGPFGQLGSLEPGAQISVTLDDGTTREYEVFERALYGKLELPRERIWRNTGPETLVLITCGGDFNPEIRRYRQNIVVYAAPVG